MSFMAGRRAEARGLVGMSFTAGAGAAARALVDISFKAGAGAAARGVVGMSFTAGAGARARGVVGRPLMAGAGAEARERVAGAGRAWRAPAGAWRVLVVALLLLVPAAASAQGWIERVGPGAFGVHKLRTTVRVTVKDRIAQVDVEEWFRNDGPPFGQADYLYPLPASASFSSYSLWQGDEELRGEMMDARDARRIYEEIVRRKRDPALIELAGHGLMRARVFPIATGETRRIRLRYTQVLGRAGDALEFRYAAGTRNPADQPSWGVPVPMPRPRPEPLPRREDPQNQTGRELSPRVDAVRGGVTEAVPLAFTLTIEDGARYAEPFSPTHALRVRRDAGRLTVESRERLSGDFALFLPFADKPVGITVAAHRPTDSEDGWFMLTLSPADVERARRVPRDVTVVLDVSGSMSGGKLAQAQAAVRQLLGTLGAQDRVRLIRFHSTVAEWQSGWTSATAANLRAARAWVDALQPEGSTNIAGALQQAFAQRSPAGRLGVVLFLTDGLPTVGERDPEQIARQAERGRGEARVFAFGVGYDVNTYLLDRLSAAARGSTQYVKPEDDIETSVSALAARIQFPVLTDLELSVAGARISEVYPSELPDLFAGDELVVFGRYTPRAGAGIEDGRGTGAGDQDGRGAGAGDRDGRSTEAGVQDRSRAAAVDADGGTVFVRVPGFATVSVRGRRGNQPERYQAQATFAPHAPAHDYIPRLWASRKIGELTQELRLHGRNDELIDEIRQTALRYGVLSEYTSYLVQEPGMVLANERFAAMPSAPSAFTGQAAVMASAESKARREVSSMAELQRADVAAAAQVVGGVSGVSRDGAGAAARTVGGRTFRERDGVWQDVLHQASARVVEVRAFSSAYFDLLRGLPELGRYASELPQLLVAGAGVSVRIHGERGQEQLSASALAALVRDFRGDKATTR